MTVPTAGDALSFTPGRYEIEAGGELVSVFTVHCTTCNDDVAYHVGPLLFDEIAEDVWRHEKVHEHD